MKRFNLLTSIENLALLCWCLGGRGEPKNLKEGVKEDQKAKINKQEEGTDQKTYSKVYAKSCPIAEERLVGLKIWVYWVNRFFIHF